MFAFGNSNAMNIYSNWFLNIPSIENEYANKTNMSTTRSASRSYPWHPESSLKRYLDISNIEVNLLDISQIIYPRCPDSKIRRRYKG
jgi:hypothetical protein